MGNVKTEVKELLVCGCGDPNDVFICFQASDLGKSCTSAFIPVIYDDSFYGEDDLRKKNKKSIIERMTCLKKNSWKVPFTIAEILDEDCEPGGNDEKIKDQVKEIIHDPNLFNKEKNEINVDFKTLSLTDKIRFILFGEIDVEMIHASICRTDPDFVYLYITLIKKITTLDVEIGPEKENG